MNSYAVADRRRSTGGGDGPGRWPHCPQAAAEASARRPGHGTVKSMTRHARPMCDRLVLRVLAQQRVLSRCDATDLGHHDMDLQAWRRAGLIVLATRGGYYLSPEHTDEWGSMTRAEREAEHERLRTLAVLHVLSPRFVASHHSALLVHRLPTLATPRRDADVHVMATGPVTAWPKRSGVRAHELITGTALSAIRAASVEDAIAQTACTDGLVAGLIPADAALAHGRLELAALAAACERMAGRPGATGLGALVGLADGRSESPGESRMRFVCGAAAIPVTPQVWIGDEAGRFARVDLLVDGTRVILEFDGLVKYTDPEDARREKRREHRLHCAGYVVVRVTWEDFADIPGLIRRIHAAIARAAATGPVPAC